MIIPRQEEKVILLTANTSWYLYNFRGSLIKELLRRQVVLASTSPPDEYSKRLVAMGIKHYPWLIGRRSINPTSELRSLFSLRKIIKECTPILIHNHTLKPILYGSLAARNSGIPVINSVAGRGFIYSSDLIMAKLLRPLMNRLLKILLKMNNQITIFENSADRTFFIENGLVNPENTVLIQSVGVDTELFAPTPLPKGEEFIIGFVGRLLWAKGIDTFIEAARILQTNENIKFVMVGLQDLGNPESIPDQVLENWKKEGLIDDWGWQEDMPSIYSQLHAVALPSVSEGVPTVLLEAAACERGIIASDIPGCREVIVDGENGYLIPVKDPDFLAKKILYIASNPDEFNKIRFQAREHVKSHFSKKSVNLATIEVYEKLLGKDFFPDDRH